MTEDEMVGWHHRLGGEFGQAPGDGEGQGSLVCYSPWCRKESDTTEQRQRGAIRGSEISQGFQGKQKLFSILQNS